LCKIKKAVKQLKSRVGLIVFWYLRISYFPDTLFITLFNKLNKKSILLFQLKVHNEEETLKALNNRSVI
ncbi:hypothetical protein EFS15_09985, partial [Lactobacillus acidophilus]|uniref:hypothetical protein n=1 Tax=Lactobacillus acidophilus TaxID=1579 RepID=UPI0035CEE6FE|nr:hypothetical protein [Lactobacillus acidophilus]